MESIGWSHEADTQCIIRGLLIYPITHANTYASSQAEAHISHANHTYVCAHRSQYTTSALYRFERLKMGPSVLYIAWSKVIQQERNVGQKSAMVPWFSFSLHGYAYTCTLQRMSILMKKVSCQDTYICLPLLQQVISHSNRHTDMFRYDHFLCVKMIDVWFVQMAEWFEAMSAGV